MLLYLLFPEGILYDREIRAYRTKEVNSVFLLISYLSGGLQNEKSGTTKSKIDYSALVDRSIQKLNLLEEDLRKFNDFKY